MYKPTFNQRKVFRFHRFARKGYALFACLGHVVTIGVLSVATLTTASAAIDHKGVVADGSTTTSATTDDTPDKEATLEDVEVTGSRAPLALGQAVRMVTVLSREDIQAAPVQSINDLLKYAAGVDVRQRGPIGAQTDISIQTVLVSRSPSCSTVLISVTPRRVITPSTSHATSRTSSVSRC